MKINCLNRPSETKCVEPSQPHDTCDRHSPVCGMHNDTIDTL